MFLMSPAAPTCIIAIVLPRIVYKDAAFSKAYMLEVVFVSITTSATFTACQTSPTTTSPTRNKLCQSSPTTSSPTRNKVWQSSSTSSSPITSSDSGMSKHCYRGATYLLLRTPAGNQLMICLLSHRTDHSMWQHSCWKGLAAAEQMTNMVCRCLSWVEMWCHHSWRTASCAS